MKRVLPGEYRLIPLGFVLSKYSYRTSQSRTFESPKPTGANLDTQIVDTHNTVNRGNGISNRCGPNSRQAETGNLLLLLMMILRSMIN